jgi:hypothetical protein
MKVDPRHENFWCKLTFIFRYTINTGTFAPMGFFARIFIILVSTATIVVGQPFLVVKDLSSSLYKYEDGAFVPREAREKNRTVYLSLRPGEYRGDFLQLRADENFSLFVNGKFAASEGTHVVYNIDSLRQVFGSPDLLLGIYHNEPSGLNVEIVSRNAKAVASSVIKPATGFRDFASVAILVLLIFFALMFRLNPKLAGDYFSISRIFSLRETEDNQVYTRITSSSNILFYVFCSLMAGFSLTVIFEFTSVAPGSGGHFGVALVRWLGLSLVVLLLFFAKIVLVYTLSALFGIKGVGGVHFFYWIRVLVVTGSILSVVVFIYFISRGQNDTVYEVMRWSITIVLISLIALVFLKLMRRAECSIFHLFSYICATEIIPFLITIKLLYQ